MSSPERAESTVCVAAQVRSRVRTATEVASAALERIEKFDRLLNCFTSVLRDRALADAAALDRRIAAGEDPGPLAGVPFAVKNLLDVAGLPTLAGSRINAERPPAPADATAVARLKQAGAILIGTLNMDEYAYGFTTENSHYGPTRNPHDPDRIAGGSSGGSAAAVAAGLVPITLGSDTNGSIRVPAALCGVFGLKPTFGRVSRAGTYPFVAALDHIGPFARSVEDIAIAFDALQGFDPRDPVSRDQPMTPTLPEVKKGIDGLRIAMANGYFATLGLPEVCASAEKVAHALGVSRTITIPEAEKARAAAYIITAAEGANLHLQDLRTRPHDFDPLIVERLLAGALIPASWYLQAQRYRSVFREKLRAVFETVDVILAPTTPCAAFKIGEEKIVIGGKELPSRPNIGVFTQPLSVVGLPVMSVPIFGHGRLPLGVQLIAAPDKEASVIRVAAELERMGVVQAPIAAGFRDGVVKPVSAIHQGAQAK